MSKLLLVPMNTDELTDRPGLQAEFFAQPDELHRGTSTSFDWTCNNLSCNYQKLMNDVTLIYSGPDLELIERNIPFVLQNLAHFTGADHVAVCSTSENYRTILAYYEWNSPDVEFLQGNSGKVTTANLLRSYFQSHKAGKAIYLHTSDSETKQTLNLSEHMRLNSINSLISIPLIYNQKMIGVVEFYYLKSQATVSERDLIFLQYFAQLQTNVLQRLRHLKKWLADADNFVTRQKGYEKELKKAREKAENIKKVKDTFFVNLSHEIRTPLNIITGMHRELMRENLNGRQKKFLQQSTAASRLLLNLFNNVMDINDMETGAFHLIQHDFNLRKLMLEVKEMMQGKILEKKSIDFQLLISENLHAAYKGDAQRLQQILVKLISNAFKFTNEGLIRVEVNIRRKTEGFHELFFEISDTGIGMSKEFVTKVFDKFAMEDDSLNRMHEGAGLGLYICYRLATLMGGTIRVESEQGIGTQFQLTLPFVLGDLKMLEAQQAHASGFNFKNLRILLVEDNDTNRFIARQTLSHTGCQIAEACNGEEAVDYLRNHNADLILMDIQMPVMNGMIATQLIRKELKLSTPIIAFTANAIDSEISKYMSFGMEDFIVKPYREIELYEKIEKFTRINITNMNAEKTNAKLYDLTYLNELSQGDESFTQQIIEAFLVMAEQSIEQLRLAQAGNDIAVVRKIAHKIKPTLANFQVTSIKSLIDKLNQADSGSINEAELKMDVDKVIDILTTIQKGLKDELK